MSIRIAIEHLRYRRFLDAHVDGELADQARARRVADHVDRCPMCREAAHTTEVVKHRLSLRRFLPTHQRARVRREES
jgi:anti-sigma factor RsiW